MQSNLAINVCDVTKIYRLYDKPIDRLKESISLTHKKYHKDLYDKAVANRHVPITTDDISQAILSLGGMRTPWYKPQRDFLNSKYNKKKHRIVLNTIDYDSYSPTK